MMKLQCGLYGQQTVDLNDAVCNGCAEIEPTPYSTVVVSLPGTIMVNRLCASCLIEAEKRLRIIFAYPLDDVLEIQYCGKTANENGD